MQDCNAIIFDLGGVLLDIDYKATERGLQQLLGDRMDRYYKQTRQSPVFDDLETGRVEPSAFRTAIRGLTESEATDEAIDTVWNAMLGALPVDRLRFIKDLGARRRLFLLSNTNAIHKAAFDRIATAASPGLAFDDFFEAAYYSHLIGLRKPDVAIFHYVVQKHGLDPARTLFVDDSKPNVEGARLAGLQAFHLQGELLHSPLMRLLD